MNKHIAAGLAAVCLVAACDSKNWEKAGFQDGYASTVNTTCRFRASVIGGQFDNAEYAKGFSMGAQQGAQAVATLGCDRLR